MATIENIGRGQYKGDEVRNAALTERAIRIMEKYHNPMTQVQAVSEMIGLLNNYIWKAVDAYKGVDEPEDLYNECVVAILEDLPNYDPLKASPVKYFKTYSIVRALNLKKEAKLNVTNHYAQVIKKIEAVEKRFSQEAVSTWTNERISALTGISPKTIQAARSQMHITLVSDEALGEISDEFYKTPEQQILAEESRKILQDAINNLDPVERRVFLEIALQDAVNWSKAKKTLEGDANLMDSLGKKTLSLGYLQATYKRARHKLNMQRNIKTLRPNYDYSDESIAEIDYDTVIKAFENESMRAYL